MFPQYPLLPLVTTLCLCLASAFTPLRSAQDELEIRNKISLYALLIDRKQFTSLDQIFTPDAVADYQVPGGSVYHGLPAIEQYIAKVLKTVVSQHTLSTLVVEQVKDGDGRGKGPGGAVNSTVYLVANFFGQGDLKDQAVYGYRTYTDSWVKVKGEWKSRARTVTLFPPGLIGNADILAAPN